MNYTIVTLHIPDASYRELFISLMDGIGYDGFEETDTELKAYIAENKYDIEKIQDLILAYAIEGMVQVTQVEQMPDQNWNALWESNFQPVVIDDKVVIKAPFHQTPAYPHEIIIEPKMAFGTGHHETTAMMIRQMLALDFNNKKVLDFGCGTGILAIMAAKLGANDILAIDNDHWAVESTIENAAINQVAAPITTVLGTHTAILPNDHNHFILANINRNVILDTLPLLAAVLLPQGHLLLSGILKTDVDDIVAAVEAQNLLLVNELNEGNWAMLLCLKPKQTIP
jgi:ribosomal protein L11 methyltransferase